MNVHQLLRHCKLHTQAVDFFEVLGFLDFEFVGFLGSKIRAGTFVGELIEEEVALLHHNAMCSIETVGTLL